MMNASGCRLVCCRHLFLIAILIVFIDRYIDASRAPDRAPILPDGWCKGGKPTATTGECICSPGVCVGQGCRRDSGFEWYTPDCSMCHCEKKGTTASQAGVNGGGTTTGSGVGVDDGVRTAFTAKSRAKPVPVDLHRADLQEEKAEPTELNSSPWLLWVEAVEDHPQVFLAAGAILAFIIAAKVMLALRSELQDEERETLRKKQQEQQGQESTGLASTTDESAKSK